MLCRAALTTGGIIAAGLPVLFKDYWEEKCKEEVREVQIGGILGCLLENRDPSRCFDLSHDCFDDPFAGGLVIPPKPPVPPLTEL